MLQYTLKNDDLLFVRECAANPVGISTYCIQLFRNTTEMYWTEYFPTLEAAQTRASEIVNNSLNIYGNFATLDDTFRAANKLGLQMIMLGNTVEIMRVFFGHTVKINNDQCIHFTMKKTK